MAHHDPSASQAFFPPFPYNNRNDQFRWQNRRHSRSSKLMFSAQNLASPPGWSVQDTRDKYISLHLNHRPQKLNRLEAHQ